MTKVFVYGTLKTGFGNNVLLQREGSTFICDDYITGFDMYSMGGFPGIVFNPEDQGAVKGEVWEVDENVLRSLDSLEGFRGVDHPNNFYNRMEVQTEDQGHFCLVYVQDTPPTNQYIESGEWDGKLRSSTAASIRSY